jgi:ParB family chromosome partitioning protein
MSKQAETAAVAVPTQGVPFSKLVADPQNVRKTRRGDSVAALADNIEADGLLQNLIVRKIKGGKFAVVGGERRRRALALLVKRKKMKESDEIPCKIIESETTSASLAENVHRLAMHPADQFEAWRQMHDEGLAVDEIAKRHGVSRKLIERRLRLGRLSPVILNALRADEITVEAATAFTLTDDHARQEAVFEALGKHHWGLQAHTIKQALTEGEVPGTNKLAVFVGTKAYEAAGGEVRRDLFGDTDYFKDRELLIRLASEGLEAEADKLCKAGWAWVETALDQDWRAGESLRRLYPESQPLSEEDQAEKERLEARLEELEADSDGHDDETYQEWDEIEAKLEAFECKSRAYSDEQKAGAGGFLALAHDGSLHFEGGFVRREDDPEANAEKKKAGKAKATEGSDYSNSLRDDLAALRLEILRAELVKNPEVARDLLAFHMVCKVLEHGCWHSPFELNAHRPYGPRTESRNGDMGTFEGREAAKAARESLPLDWFEIEDIADRFEVFRALSEADKISLQAFVAAETLKPQLADDGTAEPSLERAAAIMQTRAADYWTPNADFFGRMTKGHMLAVAAQVVDEGFASRHSKDKKGDLAVSLDSVFNPHPDANDAYPKARPRIAAWVPACMAVEETGTSDDGMSSLSDT